MNDQSILSLKKRALRRTKTLRRDLETNEVIRPSKFSQIMTCMKAPFTRQFWEDAFERSDDETLVDSKLLSYAYLEAGLIEVIGACVPSSSSRERYSPLMGPSSLTAYFVVFFKNGFTPGDLRRAQSALAASPGISA